MSDLTTIESLTKAFADARQTLAARVRQVEAEVQAVQARHLPALREAVDTAANTRARLETAIEEAPHLFVKPRTVQWHGVKVGFEKGKGAITWDDPDQVIRLIRKHLPEQAETLIKVDEKPVKKALGQLTTAELKKIGCTVVESGDRVVVRATDSEIDKVVDQLLRAADASQDEAA